MKTTKNRGTQIQHSKQREKKNHKKMIDVDVEIATSPANVSGVGVIANVIRRNVIWINSNCWQRKG